MTARTVVALLLTAAALTGCGDIPGDALRSGGSATPTVDTAPLDATDLVGRWHVEGDGVEPGTALVLGEELAVLLPCGVLDGAWEADGQTGLLVAGSSSGDGPCFGPAGRQPLSWLDGARGFDVDGDVRTLTGADGRVLATLRPGARPTAGPNRSDAHAQEPEVTDVLRARLAAAAPLPVGVRPATADDLLRRWRPIGVEDPDAHLLFAADGGFTGSDGCNGQGGRWTLGEAGRLLATSGPQTQIACEGAPVGSWVDEAGRAGIVDGDLVLHARDGVALGRLSPA